MDWAMVTQGNFIRIIPALKQVQAKLKDEKANDPFGLFLLRLENLYDNVI